MKKMSNVILTSLVVALVVLAPACRTRKKPVEPTVTPTTTSVPDVPPPPPTDTSTQVTQERDFVQEEPLSREEVFPADIEELNRYVQRQGYIRDAFYNYDESTLDDAAQAALTSSANWLKSAHGAGYNVLIEGHCDERGTEQYNLALGDRRANAVKNYLVALQVPADRLLTISYGEERPVDPGHDEAAWAKNRRAVTVVTTTQ